MDRLLFFYFKFTVYLFEFMKGHRPTTQRLMSSFNRQKTEKAKEGVLQLYFFFARFLNFISCFQKLKWKYEKFWCSNYFIHLLFWTEI